MRFKSLKTVGALSMLLGGVFTFASCSDDSPKESYPEIEENTSDLTYGLNVKMIDLSNVDSHNFSLLLNTRNDVTFSILTEDGEEHPFLMKIIENADKLKELVCEGINIEKFAELEAPATFLYTLRLRSGETQKDVKVVLKSTSGDWHWDNDPEHIASFTYARSYFGAGLNPANSFGAKSELVLDYDAMLSILKSEYFNPGAGSGGSSSSYIYDYGGHRYDKVMKYIAKNAYGISGKKLYDGVFSNTAQFGVPTQADDVENYEWYVYDRVANMNHIWANSTLLNNALKDGSFVKYLDMEANDALNNSNTEEYQKYSNDQEGIYALLDKYGPYVVTDASFGGHFTYKFARKEYMDLVLLDEYMVRMLRGGFQVDGQTNKDAAEKWMNSLGHLTLMEQFINSTYDEKDLNSTMGENYPRHIYFKNSFTGVDPKEMKVDGLFPHKYANYTDTLYNLAHWESTLIHNKDYWTLSSVGSDGLIPLYEFVVDDARKQAIKNNFDAYLQHSIRSKEQHHLVLADFYMKKEWQDLPGGKDPDIHVCRPNWEFHPSPVTGDMLLGCLMRENENSPYMPNYTLETNNGKFIDCNTEAYHFWHYMTGYHEDGEGIESIAFSGDDLSKQGYKRVGNGAHEGANGRIIDKNYVWIKYADKNTDLDHKVRSVGLGLERLSDIPSNENIATTLFATTGPTELPHFTGLEGFELMKNEWWNYWNSNLNPGKISIYNYTRFYEGWSTFPNRIYLFMNYGDFPLSEEALCSTYDNMFKRHRDIFICAPADRSLYSDRPSY